MAQKNTSYRPHPKWHNYKARGIYMITLVVQNRDHILGELNMDAKNPGVILSETGKAIVEQWNKTSELQAKYNRKVKTICSVVMPDHFHGVIFIEEDMDIKLGTIIQAFKSAYTSRWRKINGIDRQLETEKITGHLSINRRLEHYASLPRIARPLFDPDYDDTILYKRGQLQHIIDYVRDNPRRAIYRKLYPQYFRNVQTLEINGRLYSAFGNLFLLKAAHKIAVKCHRKHPDTRQPYEETDDFQKYRTEVLDAAKDGSVIVTPGISKGEQIIKNDCFENGFPMIHIQKEPFGQYNKPEKRRFDICLNGKLLIIIPQTLDSMGTVNGVDAASKYSNFHNMNLLAAEIAGFYGYMAVKRA